MDTRRLVLITAAAVCAVGLLFALLVRSGPDPGPEGEELILEPGGDLSAAAVGAGDLIEEEDLPEEATATETSEAETPSFLAEANRRDVVLFFQKAKSDFLGAERRRIFVTDSPSDQAKQIVVEVINGPHRSNLLPTVPPETRLLGLYIDRHKTAYVDLSEEAVAFHPGGSAEELTTIFSIVNSLTYNLDAVKRVRILIGGEERDTLKSHLDLRRDYVRDMSIVDRRR